MTSIATYNGGLVLSGPDGSLRVSFFRFNVFLRPSIFRLTLK